MAEKNDPDGRRAKALEDLRKTATKEELEQIRLQREFDTCKPGTPTYRMALHNDQLRKQARASRYNIEQRLFNIENLKNENDHFKTQQMSGIIKDEIRPGVPMNANELRLSAWKNELAMMKEVFAIPEHLADLRGVVGHIDVARRVIMEQEAFDTYVAEVEERVKNAGFKLFD